MRSLPIPRRRARTWVAVATAALLAPTPAAVHAAPPDAGPGSPRLVRLTVDDGSVVRSAEVALQPGVSRLRTTSYAMVAATWRGTAPEVAVRTSSGTAWQDLPLLEDLPSTGTEGVPGVRGTDLVWVGPSAGIDVRVTGTGHRDLELVLIDPGERPADDAATAARTTTATGEAAGTTLARTADRAPAPRLHTRKEWGADPDWRNGRPVYLDRLRQVHVHHTATSNRYNRSDVPGILRGIYRYHTHSLGWFDIGYNFLVDRFGRAWVGRSGGARRLVKGAHTLGFNHASVGVAVIGNLEPRSASRDAFRTLVRLTAWKLDSRSRDAVGRVRMTSSGSDKYREGQRVLLPVVDGHRDTNDTACPGQRLYDRLPTLRRRAQSRIDAYG